MMKGKMKVLSSQLPLQGNKEKSEEISKNKVIPTVVNGQSVWNSPMLTGTVRLSVNLLTPTGI